MKKALFLLLAAIVSLLALAACGDTTPPETTVPTTVATEPQISIEDYKSLALENLDELYNNAVIVNKAASYIAKYWNSAESINATITTQKLLDACNKYLEENSITTLADMEAAFDASADLYKAVYFAHIEGAEADAIKEAFDAFYNAYIGFYNLTMNPTGDRKAFNESANNYIAEIQNSVSKLDLLLE
ncbi:MAG: hypothetical protein IJ960_00715 [Oscillospiraceae bacterium]|nr:hypothetical protein [Oscillospiraceae bacterium]